MQVTLWSSQVNPQSFSVTPQSFSSHSTVILKSFHSRSEVIAQSFQSRSTVIQSRSTVVLKSFHSRSKVIQSVSDVVELQLYSMTNEGQEQPLSRCELWKMSKRPDKDAEDAEVPGWRCRRDYLWRCQNDYSLTPSGVLRPYLSNNKRNIHLCWNILWRGYNCLNIIYKIYSQWEYVFRKGIYHFSSSLSLQYGGHWSRFWAQQHGVSGIDI